VSSADASVARPDRDSDGRLLLRAAMRLFEQPLPVDDAEVNLRFFYQNLDAHRAAVYVVDGSVWGVDVPLTQRLQRDVEDILQTTVGDIWHSAQDIYQWNSITYSFFIGPRGSFTAHLDAGQFDPPVILMEDPPADFEGDWHYRLRLVNRHVDARENARRRGLQEQKSGASGTPPPAAESNAVRTGTGFMIAPGGYILTAYHIVANTGRCEVRAVNGQRVDARIVAADPQSDLVLLQADLSTTDYLGVRDSSQVKLGEEVWTLGFPNLEQQGISPKMTNGIISSLNGFRDDPRAFQISVPIQPGNSGGPLLDKQGRVVGLVFARLPDGMLYERTGAMPQNVNYAIKSARLLEFLSQHRIRPRDTTAGDKVDLAVQNLVLVLGFPARN